VYKLYFKRIFDVIISFILLILFFPIIILIFFAIYFTMGFPFFVQKRPGLNNKIFKIYKFKTLYDSSNKIPEKLRQNSLGNFLRKTGLDELPQLFNVLENNMSLVGPRPLLVEYLKKYSKYQKKRHLVKPGITGLAQISLVSTRTKNWHKTIELDIYYSTNISFFLDLYIIFRTIKLILFNKKKYKDFKKF
jgi:undecaprenyl phosphate N,N'-diacetylbacillosamine 1-phosphate transferase